MKQKLVLVDGHSILNRAFYGVPDLTNSQGLHTNAIYGFLNILFKILEEEQPEFLVVAFDVHAPTFRHTLYEAYKGTRKKMPDELREQVPVMKTVLKAMGIHTIEKEGLEADDILGTLAKHAEKEGYDVSLVSGDRDLLQIASDTIKIRIPKTKGGKTEVEDYYAKDVEEALQLTPLQFIELKALMGDTADNIPGVPKVGKKTATDLMLQYGSLDNIYEHIEEITKKSIHDSLVENKELAYLSLDLATIRTDSAVEICYDDMKVENLYTDEAYEEFQTLGFKNLLKRFQKDQGKIDLLYTILDTAEEAETFCRQNQKSSMIAYQILGSPDDIIGMTIAFGKQQILFLECNENLPTHWVLEKLLSWNKQQKNIAGFDMKRDYALLDQEEELLGTNHLFDVHIAAYLLNPLKNDYQIEDIAQEYLGHSLQSYGQLFGKLSEREAFITQREHYIHFYAAKVQAIYMAKPLLEEKLKETEQYELFRDIEMPLTLVLHHMEKEGVRIKQQQLKDYGESLLERIHELEHSIWQLAGEEFNLNSPKQLGEILFEKLGIPGGKKTKTGYSTAADVLEKLASEFPIVSQLLEYRGLAKLKSTYADGLVNYVDQEGRIHTTFQQTIAATGRISSTDPNLQNIPMRTEMGRKIRKVFVAKDGYLLVDADYSQIELRVLASLSGDEQLIEAYKQNADIHTATAAKVFHVAIDEVTPLMRRNAKAVNFGIVYGISAFGLSQDLDISRKEAAGYIETYFAMYPGIKRYLDSCVENAKKNGYTSTLFGRRRPMPELLSSNFMQRSFGERVAKNAPIQGTAADIIKIAMVQVDRRLRQQKLKSKLILQVHDELLVETAKEEIEMVKEILQQEMKKAASLPVSLEIDLQVGENWYDAH